MARRRKDKTPTAKMAGKAAHSPRRDWESFFKLVAELGVPDDFMSDRQDPPPRKRRGPSRHQMQ